MAEGAVLPGTLTEPVVTGRSLWVDARTRLIRNRAALVGMVLLALITLACLFGPSLTGHPYDTVYPDYVAAPASLQSYPRDDQVAPAVERIVSRIRARASDTAGTGDTVRVTLRGTRPIDERRLAYFGRSDLFGPATVVERGE